MTELPNVLHLWPIGPVDGVVEHHGGSMNRTWMVTASSGRYALREYCRTDMEGVRREHALIRLVADAGVPAPTPLPAANGNTWVEDGSRIFALFAEAQGEQIPRDALRLKHLTALGQCLAKLQTAMQRCPVGWVKDRKRLTPDVDVDSVLAECDRVERKIIDRTHLVQTDRWALKRLRERREWIEAHRACDLTVFATLPCQPIHGDFQESNLFFAGGEVSAIIDWEKACLAPAAWDAVRFVDLVTHNDPERSRAFLEAYLAARPTSWDALDAVACVQGWYNTVSLWLYRGIYDAGDDRLRRFVNRPPFRAQYDRWSRLREALHPPASMLRRPG